MLIVIATLSLPFLAKKPIDLPPLVSVELIQITDKTNIPFAPKAKKIIEKIKEKEKKLVSEQAPPKKVKKISVSFMEQHTFLILISDSSKIMVSKGLQKLGTRLGKFKNQQLRKL